ncbi:MAG: DUF3768 domain-containing protein [Sphingomonas sp.]|nr:DUF3768 domain-containing protein [Sphingomonas sp.]
MDGRHAGDRDRSAVRRYHGRGCRWRCRYPSVVAFGADVDPYGEHDFGSFSLFDQRFFWKIDYYDRSLSAGSPDPADAAATCRVLTIMLTPTIRRTAARRRASSPRWWRIAEMRWKRA